MNPAACAARMWQRNDDRMPAGMRDLVFASDGFVKWHWTEKAVDCKSSHGNQDAWLDDAEFVIQPARAETLLRRGGYAVSPTAWMRTREASRNGGDIDVAARGDLIETDARQPFEKRLSSAASERAPSCCFHFSWRLTNEHGARRARLRHDGANVLAEFASIAGQKLPCMRIERLSKGKCEWLLRGHARVTRHSWWSAVARTSMAA